MKALIIIFLLGLTLKGYGQDTVKGAFYDHKTGKQIKLSLNNTDTPRIYIEGAKKYFYNVDKDGKFSIPVRDIINKRVSLSIINFNISDQDNDFADLEIKDIPSDSLKLVVSKIFLDKVYWVTHGRNDNYWINAKKTFSKKNYLVDNGLIKYRVRREPENIKKFTIGVKYVAEFGRIVLR